MISSKLISLRRGGLCLSAAFVLALTSCASTFVPLADEHESPSIRGGEGSDRNPVVYQGETAKEAKSSRSSVQLLVGQRSLDETQWQPVEDQVSVSVEYNWMPADFPVGFEVGLGASIKKTDITASFGDGWVTGTTAELYAGPRFETALGDSPVRIYGGLGPSLISASMEVELGGISVTQSDSTLGFYAHAGILVDLGSVFLGLDLRTLAGTSIDIGPIEADADYTQAALVFGFTF